LGRVNDGDEHDRALAEGWLAAARDPEVAGALEAVHWMIREAVEARGPACWASGRCCNFKNAGHLLYVTGLEAAYTVARSTVKIGMDDVAAAALRGDCPYLGGNLCGAHAMKPVGCRVYFCERGVEAWQNDLSEQALRVVRGIHERHGVEYRYGEWRAMLKQVMGAMPGADCVDG